MHHLLRFCPLRVMLCDIYNCIKPDSMPRCEVDSVLLDQVRRFISVNRLTISGAATALGVDRTTFWRFFDTGRAISSTRTRYREALENCNKQAEAYVADDAVDADQARPALQGVLADREIKQIRKACEGVLALLNIYEAQQSLGRKN